MLCSLIIPSASISAEETPSVKIGVILSLSGGLEQWCNYIRQGIELAQSEEAQVHAEIVFEDDHSFEKKAILGAAHKLLHVDKVDLLVSWTASTVPMLSSLAASAKTLFFVGAYDQNVAKGGPFVAGAYVNYEIVPREIAQFLIRKKGARRVGLVMADDNWAQNFERPFTEEVKKLGGTLVFSETIAPDAVDTRSLILKLKKEKIDAVLAPLYSLPLYSFLKNAKELQFPGIIHVADSMFEEDIKNAGPSAEGVYASQIWLDSPQFTEAFKKHFGITVNPLQLGLVASGYDWVKHVQKAAAELIKNGELLNRDTLRQKLMTYRSTGYLGEQMFGGPPTHAGEITVQVEKGRYVQVK